MKKIIHQIALFALLLIAFIRVNGQQKNVNQNDVFNFQNDTAYQVDSLAADSLFHLSNKRGYSSFGLLDTLTNDTILNAIFKPYIAIQTPYFPKRYVRTNLPTFKEVRERPIQHQQWKFWVIMLIIGYIAFVRISNPNNFRVFIQSVFNLKLSRKIWESQKSFFSFVIFQLFAIYLFIATMFVSNYLELRNIQLHPNMVIQFLIILIVLIGVYMGKFIIHFFMGLLLKMNNLAVGFISNTISVNNFIALVIFPVTVLSIYVNQPILSKVFAQAIIAIFMISIGYRLIRIWLLSNTFFSFPTFYLFVYLCALEIAPWFIIVKFINRYLA
ncbi:MAG: DUF4271 domain-containing protein [Bacteroidota bacterium]|jgi:hypothetical protein